MMRKRDITIWHCDICGKELVKETELSTNGKMFEYAPCPSKWNWVVNRIVEGDCRYALVCDKHDFSITIDGKPFDPRDLKFKNNNVDEKVI